MAFGAFIPPGSARAPAPPPEPAPAPAARLEATLDAIGWSTEALGRRTGVSPSTALRWARGTIPVPPEVTAWLEDLAAYHRARPVPPFTTRQPGNPVWIARRPTPSR